MQVQGVNNSTSFYGSPNRAVFRYLNKLKKAELKKVKRDAKFQGKTATQEQLNQVYNLAENIRYKLTEYTSKLHPKTKLNYRKNSNFHWFKIENPLIHNKKGSLTYNSNILLYDKDGGSHLSHDFTITAPHLGGGYIHNESLYNNIHELNEWVKNMELIDPKEINKWFMDTALIGLKNKAESARGNIFKKWYVRYLVSKIAKYNEEALVDVNISKDSLKEDVQRIYLGCETKYLPKE